MTGETPKTSHGHRLGVPVSFQPVQRPRPLTEYPGKAGVCNPASKACPATVTRQAQPTPLPRGVGGCPAWAIFPRGSVGLGKPETFRVSLYVENRIRRFQGKNTGPQALVLDGLYPLSSKGFDDKMGSFFQGCSPPPFRQKAAPRIHLVT